jgi:hypothetical protein
MYNKNSYFFNSLPPSPQIFLLEWARKVKNVLSKNEVEEIDICILFL